MSVLHLFCVCFVYVLCVLCVVCLCCVLFVLYLCYVNYRYIVYLLSVMYMSPPLGIKITKVSVASLSFLSMTVVESGSVKNLFQI